MVTFEQISKLGYGDELHYTGRHDCKVNVGPRGGVQENITRVRVSGQLKTWKREPWRFRLPVKYGLYESGAINQTNMVLWHLASECPALAEYADFLDSQRECELCYAPNAILGPNGYFCAGACAS